VNQLDPTSALSDSARKLIMDLLSQGQAMARLVCLGHDRYQSDEWLQLSAKALVIDMGEAAGRLSRVAPELTRSHPGTSLVRMINVRNLVAHGYDHVDYELLWTIMKDSIPTAVAALAALLDQPPPEGE